MATYTLSNAHGSFTASSEFVVNCDVYKNMFEDIGEPEEGEVLTFSDDFDPKIVENYCRFFEEVHALKGPTNDDGEVPYTEFISEYKEEIKKNWLYKNEKPPLCDELVAIYRKYFRENKTNYTDFEKILEDFFMNSRVLRSMYFLTAIFVRFAATEEEEQEIMGPIMDRLQEQVDDEAQKMLKKQQAAIAAQ
jgi:hypothetical protein